MADRRLSGWQRSLRWAAWLAFLGAAVWNSATSESASFTPLEWITLVFAVAISIWCLARPMGGRKVELTDPQQLVGDFVSRTSWGLVLLGALVLSAGVAGAGAAAHDLATGRASLGEVFRDMANFVEGWTTELIFRMHDAELENTHAYALMFLVAPGFALVWYNLIPFVNRGTEFRVQPDGSVSVRQGTVWEPLQEYQYATVVANGTIILFNHQPGGPASLSLPQYRVFSREYGGRLKSALNAEFFRRLLAGRGFVVDGVPAGNSFNARRTA